MKKLIENKLVIASHNPGKIKELSDLFKTTNIEILTSTNFNLDAPIEDGNSFEENALIKSIYTAENSGFVSLSDDSGLCIDALNGNPGIHSARLAGKNKDFEFAIKKLQSKLKHIHDKSCKFVCSLSLCWPSGYNITVKGEIYGEFSWPPRGKFGFGYDPIFLPIGYNQTFGEMNPEEKHSISHRQIAFEKLIQKSKILN